MTDLRGDLTTRELLDEMRRRLRETHPDFRAYLFAQLMPHDLFQPDNEHHRELAEVITDWLEAEFKLHRHALHSEKQADVETAISYMSERLKFLESK